MTVRITNILLPEKNVDLPRYAVIACDQFTSQPAYWEEVNDITRNCPSTRHITLPEIYLSKTSQQEIAEINTAMKKYLDEGILRDIGESLVLVVRSTPYAKRRVGIILAIDLEDYDYSPRSASAVRATEGTVLERIPPRIRIRKDALLELPHIMLLYNDKENKVSAPLLKDLHKMEKLYDIELMCKGGHLTGYKIENAQKVAEDLEQTKKGSILFAVGDGNHSLATAKALWEELKVNLSEKERENHPARFALAEAVNLYDEGIIFQPIHRVVFDAPKTLMDDLKNIGGKRTYQMYFEGKDIDLSLPEGSVEAVIAVQQVIDKYVSSGQCTVDYVHGAEDAKQVVREHKGSLGILLPTISKEELFPYVEKNGPLPRKTFSMGEAVEKRYYMEARKIK